MCLPEQVARLFINSCEVILTRKDSWQKTGDLEDLLNEEALAALQQGDGLTKEEVWRLVRHLPEQTLLLVLLGLEYFNKLPAEFRLPSTSKPRSKPADDRAERRLRGLRAALAAVGEMKDRDDLWYVQDALEGLRKTLPEKSSELKPEQS